MVLKKSNVGESKAGNTSPLPYAYEILSFREGDRPKKVPPTTLRRVAGRRYLGDLTDDERHLRELHLSVQRSTGA